MDQDLAMEELESLSSISKRQDCNKEFDTATTTSWQDISSDEDVPRDTNLHTDDSLHDDIALPRPEPTKIIISSSTDPNTTSLSDESLDISSKEYLTRNMAPSLPITTQYQYGILEYGLFRTILLYPSLSKSAPIKCHLMELSLELSHAYEAFILYLGRPYCCRSYRMRWLIPFGVEKLRGRPFLS